MPLITSVNEVPGHDRFELNRLADELAAREANSIAHRYSAEVELPELQPLTHDNVYLKASEFNVEEFLLSRSNTSLSDLRAELREYLAKLKEELVGLINDDYEAFISLSTDLQGEGARLERIKCPLGELYSQIQVARSQLENVQGSVKEKLDRRATLREEKTLLQLLLKISDSITRLESLLLISSPQQDDSRKRTYADKAFTVNGIVEEKSSKTTRAKHLLRIASEYNQLLYHARKASNNDCAFVAENQWRIDRIKSTLSSDLEHHFASTLLSIASTDKMSSATSKQGEMDRGRLMSDLVDCLRAYDILGLWRDAEDIIRREVVRTFVKKTVYPGCLSGPRSPTVPPTPFAQKPFGTSSALHQPPTPYTPYAAFPSRTSSFFSNPLDLDSTIYLLEDSENNLAGLYNQILRFVARDMRPILDAAEQVSAKGTRKSSRTNLTMGPQDAFVNAEGHGFDILSNVIWTDVSRAIIDDLGSSVFAAGKPDEFRRNYETTQAFIRSFEYLAPSLQSVLSFREHTALEAFIRRWQLPVYFQLRWKYIVGRVEEALESKALSPSRSSGQSAFGLSQSQAVWEALQQCWSNEIYLSDLGPNFWKLTLQLIKRYHSWIEDNLPPLENARKFATDKISLQGSAIGLSPTPNQDTPSAGDSIEEDKRLHQCALLMQDIKELELAVMCLWQEQISFILPQATGEEDNSSKPGDALRTVVASVVAFIPVLSSQVEAILARRCCDALSPVRNLAGQFRATSQKNMPSKPSAFVPLILRPVKLFFGVESGNGGSKALRKDFCAPISSNVVESVSNKYMSHLSGMRKTEESLRRLRMGKRTGFSLFGNSSTSADDDMGDEERVRAQLILDVQAFGKEAESLGVNLDMCSSFKALISAVHTYPGE